MKRILHGRCYIGNGDYWTFKCGIVKSDINHAVISSQYTHDDQIMNGQPYGIITVGLRRNKLIVNSEGIIYTDMIIRLHYDTYAEADKVYGELLKDLEYLNKPLWERMAIRITQLWYKLIK